MDKKIWNQSQKPGLINSTKLFFQDLFVGAKRVSRRDFWWGYLGTTIFFAILIGILVFLMKSMPLMTYYWSAVIGVAIAISFGYYLIAIYNAAIRRLHDINLKAWWMLLILVPFFGYIILLVMMSLGQRNANNRFEKELSVQP
ncbi:DUF805 domain-containing protein [Companilactobacillus versmoldensis]|uniref:DUF805 domain-containing protein n=1 Tax=Companilactobacillus versmoldensis DSM 14857 = KCTC 3814 TaxID=1423815 RepID=A0A0R1SBK1_9LACO|nr:DUF805 domain-containing protein [Companilactobacillus versmoldensis]KRL65854.1 hypothetical protein FC27_GL001223 [Companilactobacillus versmoldensis DSM 14857 = KCTC 3814]